MKNNSSYSEMRKKSRLYATKYEVSYLTLVCAFNRRRKTWYDDNNNWLCLNGMRCNVRVHDLNFHALKEKKKIQGFSTLYEKYILYYVRACRL